MTIQSYSYTANHPFKASHPDRTTEEFLIAWCLAVAHRTTEKFLTGVRLKMEEFSIEHYKTMAAITQVSRSLRSICKQDLSDSVYVFIYGRNILMTGVRQFPSKLHSTEYSGKEVLDSLAVLGDSLAASSARRFISTI